MDNLWLELDNFPKEILELIISYVGSDEQLNMRLANTKWFKLVNYRNFTLKFTTEKTLPHIVDRMLQYNGPIGLKFIKPRCKKLAAQLSRLTNLTSLKLPNTNEGNVSPEVWWSFTTLTNLREFQAHNCPASVAASLINMRELTLDSLDILVVESMKKMSNLEVLNCQPISFEPLDLDSLDVVSLLPCPARLTHFITNGKFDHTNASKLYNLRELTLFFNENDNTPQLSLDKFTSLNSFSTGQDHLSFGALPTTLTYLAIDGSSLDLSCHQHLTRLHNIKELNIDTLYINDEQYSWISHLTSLQYVSIWPQQRGINESYTGAVFGMINSSKLVSLSSYVTSDVDLGHLSRLTTLEELFLWESDLAHPDYSFTSHLMRLTSFTVYSTSDRPSLTALANLPTLKKLKMTGIRGHTAEIPISLEHLTHLESLVFDRCKTNVFESLSVLTRLTCLNVKCLPDINYEFLKAMPLQDLRISADADDRLYEAHDGFYTVLVQLTGLRSLRIQGLSADQVLGLSALQHLTLLEVAKCNINEGKNITRLTKLQVLSVEASLVDTALLETSLSYLVDLRVRQL